MKGLDGFLERERDRELFSLSPRPGSAVGLLAFLEGLWDVGFSLSGSVAVWSSGCPSLLFPTREGGLGACPHAQWGVSPAAVIRLSALCFPQVGRAYYL